MKKLILILSLFCSCKKSADCPTWTADTYTVSKGTGVTPPPNGTVSYKSCDDYSGKVTMYREDANFKYYRRTR
jgi:hypothetical protein